MIVAVVLILFGTIGYAQEVGYDIFSTYSKPIIKWQLESAKSMVDINADYPSSWIDESDYISSEIKVTNDGAIISAIGENDVLTSEQIDILKSVEIGTKIDIEIKYNVKNSITGILDVKTMNFSVSLVPEKEAEYIGGHDKMKDYLKSHVVDKINKSGNNKFEMAKVRFYVDENGVTNQANIFKSSENEKVDQLLLETIANMPKWKPAEGSDGVKIQQEFEFVVGTMIGC